MMTSRTSRPAATRTLRMCLALALWLCTLAPLLLVSPAHAERREVGALIYDQVPAIPTDIPPQLAPWLEVRSASFRDFLPDGGVLISTRFGNSAQLHRVDRPLAAREQLTFAAEPVASAQMLGSSIVFSRDAGGNENAQLWQLGARGGEARLLTDGRSRHGGALGSPDGKRLVFFGNNRNGRDQDVYLLQTDGSAPRLLVAAQGQTWQPLDWSRDGRSLLLRNFISVTESELFIAEVETGALRRLDIGDQGRKATKIAIGTAGFSADGLGIWLISDLAPRR